MKVWAILKSLFHRSPGAANSASAPIHRGPCAVMCCGCQRFMGPTGLPVEINFGAINWSNIGSYHDSDEADKAALGFGWQVRDEIGSNHRCRDCQPAGRRRSTLRGAIVPWGVG